MLRSTQAERGKAVENWECAVQCDSHRCHVLFLTTWSLANAMRLKDDILDIFVK